MENDLFGLLICLAASADVNVISMSYRTHMGLAAQPGFYPVGEVEGNKMFSFPPLSIINCLMP